MFVLKGLASAVLFPVALVLEITVLGLLLLWFTRRQRVGKVLITVGAVTLALLSIGFVADLLLAPLEGRYARFPPRSGGLSIRPTRSSHCTAR